MTIDGPGINRIYPKEIEICTSWGHEQIHGGEDRKQGNFSRPSDSLRQRSGSDETRVYGVGGGNNKGVGDEQGHGTTRVIQYLENFISGVGDPRRYTKVIDARHRVWCGHCCFQ